jgi:5,6,7,8-tetrahydromethanopterin hydro-lyase
VSDFVTQVGEGFAGEPPHVAHVNTVLGAKGGPVETAWASGLAHPVPGHTPFVVVLQPGLPVKPLTLFVSKATVSEDRHATLTWGAAQAGVATGVARALDDGTVDRALADDLLLIAAVWVDPTATDADLVFAHNDAATHAALRAGRDRAPDIADVLAARARAFNPYFGNS